MWYTVCVEIYAVNKTISQARQASLVKGGGKIFDFDGGIYEIQSQ